MDYNPTQAPDGLDPILQFWVEDELRRIAEAMSEAQASVTLYPVGNAPLKYEEGTLVNFLPGTVINDQQTIQVAGFYVFRNATGRWHLLQEV